MRCPYGRPRLGDHTRYFAIGENSEEVYCIQLCGEHARRFDLDFNVWATLADVVEPGLLTTGVVRPKVSQAVGDDDAARIRELRERAARSRTTAVVEDNRDEVLIGPRGDQWRFTKHAQDRARQRQFTPEQVLKAAAYPETRMPSPSHPGRYYHVTDPCCAVVDPETRLIITVYTKFQYLCKSVNEAQKAGVS
jgi:hypothetical protein